MRTFLSRAGFHAAIAAVGLGLGGCASPTYHDPFDRAAFPSAQSAQGGAAAGPSLKVLLSGSTASSMRDMADFSNFGARMLNPASMIDAIDPRHMQDELNRVLEPRFRSIDYLYWNEPDNGSKADYLLTLEISVTLAKHSFAENRVDLLGVLTGPEEGQKESLAGHGTSKMGFPASTKTFEAARTAAFDEFGRSLGSSRLLAALGAPGAALAQAPAPSPVPVEASPAREPEVPHVLGGVYDVESKITFNVLDSVYFDAASGQLALVGHQDVRFKNQGIPYLQYLATLLEYPKPEVSLKWTPESIRQVDSLLARELTQQESDEQGERLGKVVDSSGLISRTGTFMLPALGISPINGNKAPGDLGMEVGSAGNGQVVVMKLKPGSAAEKAGLKLIDFIYSVGTDETVFYKSEFERRVRFAGAGSTVKVVYSRDRQWHTTYATLDAAADTNVWRDVSRYDLIGLLYRAQGDVPAATVIEIMGVMNSMNKNGEDYAGLSVNGALMDSLGLTDEYKHMQEVGANGAPPYQDSYNLGLKLSRQFDSIFHFNGSPLENFYLSSVRQSNNPGTAVSGVMGEFDRQILPKVGDLLDRLIYRPGVGFQIPPELVEEEYHIHPEMTPVYLGVPPDSQLAHLMISGDYLCKKLTNSQSLKAKIPGYQTQVEYQINHPDASRQGSSAYRMWTSIAGLDAAQSADAKTLVLRGARMRFNMVKTDSYGNDLPNSPTDGYADFLTGLFDPLEQEFPRLHEVREAAKLVAVAAWMKGQDSAVRLPVEGRAGWKGEAKVKGLVYIYLTQNLRHESKIIKIAEGGLSYDPARSGNIHLVFPTDTSVVDLRGNPTFATLFTRPAGASVGSKPDGASTYVASWAAPVPGGATGQQAVVLQTKQVVPQAAQVVPQTTQAGSASAFGTPTSNPTLSNVDQGTRLKDGADTSASHQLNAIATAQAIAGSAGGAEGASNAGQRGFDTITKSAGAVDTSGVKAPPSEPEEIQIPASMIDNKDLAADMLKLSFYKQQAKQSRDAAAEAQANFEAERSKDPKSAQLSVLLVKAREAQDKAGNLDNMVKEKTGEIKKKISFVKVSTDGDGAAAPEEPAQAAEAQPSTGQPPTQTAPQLPQKQ